MNYSSFCAFFCFCFCLCAANNTPSYSTLSAENKFVLNNLNQEADYYLENINTVGGVGSSPPHCVSKCGRCMPCEAVHMSLPPGTRLTTEYYPEAWRCKCGNKFYMP